MNEESRERRRLRSRFYQFAFIHAQDIILMFDRRSARVVEANDAACEAYGYSHEEFLELTIDALRLPQRRGVPFAPDGQYPMVFETEHVRKNGEVFPVWIRAHSATIEGQEVIFSMLSDLTDRRHYEAEIKKARDEALAAAELRSRFIATMSHEIRTPMNAIIGVSEMLLSTDLPPVFEEQVGLLHTAARSLLDLVGDLLDLSKLEAGKMELRSEPFALATVVRDAASILTGAAAGKGLHLETSIAPNVPVALAGDPARLQQVLVNLLSNAVKFTERGAIAVRVTRLEDLGEANVLRFEVSDTGIGLSEEQQSRIFAPFVQADASWSRQTQGTGLGLWLCTYLVERMGGAIGVQSELGKGSTFWFTVALRPAATPASPPPHRDETSDDLAASSGTPLRILVAEDNVVSQRVVAMQLRRLGHDPVVVENGAAAVEALRLGTYALVLMDCQMPVLDGLEATKRIRAAEGEGTERLPVIAMTANVLSHPSTYIEAGFDDILRKPVTLAALRAIIDRWTRGEETHVDASRLTAETLAALDHAVERLLRAVDESDLAKAGRASHRLEELAESCDARELIEIAQRTTALALDSRHDDLNTMMFDLATALRRVHGSLARLRA